MSEIVLDADQIKARDLCMDVDNRIVIVSGAAGTGKTTIQQNVYEALVAAGYSVALASPTGKAARRQTQVTGHNAVTIHKLLEFPMPGEIDERTGKPLSPSIPKRCRSFPLDYDIVIVDEYTMVPHELHRQLIDALPKGGLLRCFGDRNQLRPVETNNLYKGKPSPFEAMLASFPCAILEKVHRQAADSGVLYNAHRVLRGLPPGRRDDFRMHLGGKPPEVLVDEITELQDKGYDFTNTDCQVLSCTKKRWTGTYAINQLMQKRFNPNFRVDNAKTLDLPRYRWDEEDYPIAVAPGDKVIWTKNNYDLGLMNGDQGIVLDISEFGDIDVKFDGYDEIQTIPPLVQYTDDSGRLREYDPRRDIDLAWCITTHKAQGSEYRAVIYITSKEAQFLLWRGNFYTALTRASELFTFIGTQQTLRFCVARKEELQYSKR